MAIKYIYITNFDQLDQSEIDALESQASTDCGGNHVFTVSSIEGKEGHAFIQMEEENAPIGSNKYNQEQIKAIIKGPDWVEEGEVDYEALAEEQMKFGRNFMKKVIADNSRLLASGEMTPTMFNQMLGDPDFQTVSALINNVALRTAHQMMSMWPTKPWITDERRDEYIASLANFLGL